MSWASCVALLLLASTHTSVQAQSQQTGNPTQDSWPHVYPGMPSGDYDPEWRKYFQVTESLPNVTWPLSRNWAGNIPVQRAGYPNNTLFFWAFESLNGSFTADSNEPWAIWLNGGPGGSSLFGLLFEASSDFLYVNGPIRILGNYSVVENPYAWTNVADHVWLDQPVGTGFSTVDADGLVADEDQLADDFMGFLDNFVKVFPNLATRPLYLAGESYAGMYIPYIAKAHFQMENSPVNLARIAIGNGALVSMEIFTELPVVTVLETYPQIIGYDTQVMEYFREQSALCGYNVTLQYPQAENFPTLNAIITPSAAAEGDFTARFSRRRAAKFGKKDSASLKHRKRLRERHAPKYVDRTHGKINPWYQCDLHNEMIAYALNYTFPWLSGHLFDVYNILDALSPEVPTDASVFLNDPQTRAAIHAPTSKYWVNYNYPVFAPINSSTNPFGDPSVETDRPMAFLTDLATNATAHGMNITIYSGNDDSLIPHFGSQGKSAPWSSSLLPLADMHNATFGGVQGFSRKPETPWYNDAGEFAGIVHQERGWTYVLVAHAGHFVAYTNPISALTLAREFIFGNNRTGLVTGTSSGTITVVGGEESILENEVLRGQAGIYYGQGTTASTYFFPSATVKAWDAYIAAARSTPTRKPGTRGI
ncbi:Alpha/Beta hydrolase fold [Tylopilus felleus]